MPLTVPPGHPLEQEDQQENFYDVYKRVVESLGSLDRRYDQLPPLGKLIYDVGKGNRSYSDLTPEETKMLEPYGGGPGFLQSLTHRFADAFRQTARGIDQIIDLPENVQERGVTGSGTDAVKGLFNIGMGGLGMLPGSWVGGALGETGWRAAGAPGGEWGRTAAEVLGDFVTTGGAAVAKRALTGTGFGKAVAPLRVEPNVTHAPASGIHPVPPYTGGPTTPLAPAARVYTPDEAERLLMAGWPNTEKTPYNQALRDSLLRMFPKGGLHRPEPKRIPGPWNDAALYDFMADPSIGFKQVAEELTSALRGTGVSDEGITALIRARASLLLNSPTKVASQKAIWRGQTVRHIEEWASQDKELAERIGVVFRGKTLNDPQLQLFGSTVPDAPGHVFRTGPTKGDVLETSLLKAAPGQLPYAVTHQLNLFDTQATLIDQALRTKGGRIVTDESIETAKAIAEKSKDPGAVQKIHNAMLKSVYAWVTGPTNVFRNVPQQAARRVLGITTQAYKTIVATGSIEEAMDVLTRHASSMVHTLSRDDTSYQAMTKGLLSRLTPEQAEQLALRGMYGEALKKLPAGKFMDDVIMPVYEFANIPNQLQETAFWMSAFRATIGAKTAKYERALGRPLEYSEVPQDVVDYAVKFANEVTMSRPLEKHLRQAVDKLYAIPGVGLIAQEVQAFPRFNFANALMDLIDFSPAGAGKGFYQLLQDKPEEAYDLFAKSIIGVHLLRNVAAQKVDTKDAPYVLEVPGAGKVDARKFSPLQGLALIGEVMNRPLGSPNARVRPMDFEQAILGSQRIDDTALGLFTTITTLASGENQLQDILANFVARWTTPGRWGRAAEQVVTASPESMILRDYKQHVTPGGIFDKALDNTPFYRLLPPRIDTTSPLPAGYPGDNPRTEAAKRVSGLALPPANPVRDELTRLSYTGPKGAELGKVMEGLLETLNLRQASDPNLRVALQDFYTAGDFNRKLYASTGDRATNRVMNEQMSQIAPQVLVELINAPAFKEMSNAKQRYVLDLVIERIRRMVRPLASTSLTPSQRADQLLNKIRPTLRGVIDEALR